MYYISSINKFIDDIPNMTDYQKWQIGGYATEKVVESVLISKGASALGKIKIPKIKLLNKATLTEVFEGGQTFRQYKSSYWSNRVKPTLDPIINPNTGKVWKQYMELHHRFIPQRARWAPNWLKNNGFNLKPLSSLHHSMVDPYRARFAPKWIKEMYNLNW